MDDWSIESASTLASCRPEPPPRLSWGRHTTICTRQSAYIPASRAGLPRTFPLRLSRCEGRTQQGKCFVFSSSIRSPGSKATSVGGRSRLLGPKRTSSLVMAVSGYSVLPGLRRLVAKAGIRLRGSSPDCADVHGEGWIPVPLPPSKWWMTPRSKRL